MYLKAQELIPRYRPRFVVFQFSDWLPKRAAGMFRSSAGIRMPKPYFEILPSGEYSIRPTPYRSALFDYDRDSIINRYSAKPLRFLIGSGFTQSLLSEDWHRFKVMVDEWLGRVHPASDAEEDLEGMTAQAYRDLIALARKYGAEPRILYLSKQSKNMEWLYPSFLSPADSSLFIDGQKYHRRHLESNPSASLKWDFIHWRIIKGDSVVIDQHPNHLSNLLISKSIAENLRNAHPASNGERADR
jgi:hypothetical protein